MFLSYNLDTNKFIPAVNKGETIEELIKSGIDCNIRIYSDKYDKSVEESVQKILKQIKGSNIKINSLCCSYKESYIYDKGDIESFKSINSFCEKNNINFDVSLNGAFGEYNKYLIARQKIEDFVEKLNSTTIEENGIETPLSVGEKYILIHRFVSKREYHEDEENFFNDDMRNWIGLLSTDYAICSGFASLLKMLCDRVFTEEEVKCFEQGSDVFDKNGEKLGGHANNLVYIKDEKYGLDGFYYCDTCWDSVNDKESTLSHCLIPFDQAMSHKRAEFVFHNTNLVYQEFGAKVRQEISNYDELAPLLYENKVDEFLFKKFKMKTPKQIAEEFDIKGKIEKQQQEINDENKAISALIDRKMETVEQNKKLKPMLEIVSTTFIPQKISEEYPFLEKFNEYLDTLTLESEIDENLIKEYYEFYNEHREIFERLQRKAEELDFKFFMPLSEIIKKNIYKKEEIYFDYVDIEKGLKAQVAEKIRQEQAKVIQKSKPIMHVKEIPESLLRRSLIAIQKMEGIENPNFVEEKLAETRRLKPKDFSYGESEDELE